MHGEIYSIVNIKMRFVQNEVTWSVFPAASKEYQETVLHYVLLYSTMTNISKSSIRISTYEQGKSKKGELK